MNLLDLQTQIQLKSPKNFYVFAGIETGIMKIYWNQIAKLCKMEVEWIDDLNTCLNRIKRSILISTPKLYIVFNDRSLLSRKPEYWDTMPRRLKNNILIMVYTNLDKKSASYKRQECVPFERLPSDTLAKYITNIVPMSTNSAIQLAEICECSYDRCLLEADKIKCYMEYEKANNNDLSADLAFRDLLYEGCIYQPIGDITFNLVNAIVERNSPTKVEKLLLDARKIGEPPLLTFSLLYNKYRTLMLIKSVEGDPETISQKTGLSIRDVKYSLAYLDKYDFEELVTMVTAIQDIEYGIKTGGIKEEISLQYFIAKYI